VSPGIIPRVPRSGSRVVDRQVLNSFVVHAAANQALHLLESKASKASSVNTALVHCLSPAKSFGDALRSFGVQPDSSAVVVAVFDTSAAERVATAGAIAGTVGSIKDLDELACTDAKQVCARDAWGGACSHFVGLHTPPPPPPPPRFHPTYRHRYHSCTTSLKKRKLLVRH